MGKRKSIRLLLSLQAIALGLELRLCRAVYGAKV
jgi:hypothetical protein